MLLWRVKELLEGGGELLRAEAELASKRFTRALAGTVVLAASVLVVLLGLGLALGGLTVYLAHVWGLPEALCAVGGALAGVGAIAWSVVYQKLTGSEAKTQEDGLRSPEGEAPRVRAEDAKEKMGEAVSASPSGAPGADDDSLIGTFDKWKDAAVDQAMRHPVAAAGLALVAIGAVGPIRSVRLISRAVGVVGLAASLMDTFTGEPKKGPSPAAPRGGHGHPASDPVRPSPSVRGYSAGPYARGVGTQGSNHRPVARP